MTHSAFAAGCIKCEGRLTRRFSGGLISFPGLKMTSVTTHSVEDKNDSRVPDSLLFCSTSDPRRMRGDLSHSDDKRRLRRRRLPSSMTASASLPLCKKTGDMLRWSNTAESASCSTPAIREATRRKEHSCGSDVPTLILNSDGAGWPTIREVADSMAA
jgi:hypothetical protein